jgi:hypothetical protein
LSVILKILKRYLWAEYLIDYIRFFPSGFKFSFMLGYYYGLFTHKEVIMVDDLQSILQFHRSKRKADSSLPISSDEKHIGPSSSEIPDLFFDKIIVDYKLSRIEILILMYIYRRVWSFPNLHRSHGISPMMSHTEMAKNLGLAIEEVYSALRKLEEYSFIKTIRAGQYFSRRFFTKDFDELFGQSYDDFEI